MDSSRLVLFVTLHQIIKVGSRLEIFQFITKLAPAVVRQQALLVLQFDDHIRLLHSCFERIRQLTQHVQLFIFLPLEHLNAQLPRDGARSDSRSLKFLVDFARGLSYLVLTEVVHLVVHRISLPHFFRETGNARKQTVHDVLVLVSFLRQLRQHAQLVALPVVFFQRFPTLSLELVLCGLVGLLEDESVDLQVLAENHVVALEPHFCEIQVFTQVQGRPLNQLLLFL